MEDAQREIEQFLYREARLLDDRQFHRWLDLLTDDLRYWMPMKSNRYHPESRAVAALDENQQEPRELTQPDELAIMDETKDSLSRRIERLGSGFAWPKIRRPVPATSFPTSRRIPRTLPEK